MVKPRFFIDRPLALLIGLLVSAPALAQSVSVPVVQKLPEGYRPGSEPQEGAPRPSAPLVIPMVGEGGEWDHARARHRQSGPTDMAFAISRWKMLNQSDSLSFADYSGFVLSYPGLPNEAKFRRNAERALDREGADASRVVAYFDRMSPLTNAARAQYALALASSGRLAQAQAQGLAAWRGGAAGERLEGPLAAMLAGKLTVADHDARMDALLWAGLSEAAARQMDNVSLAMRPLFASRLAALQGNDPGDTTLVVPAGAYSDAGWLYNRARQLRRINEKLSAASLLANRPALSRPPLDAEKWVELQLAAARDADASTAVRIAAKIDDGFAPGQDISQLSFDLRDDYTSLMWLGGQRSLYHLNDPRGAAPLFWRYGAAARTPQTRSKGFYWAGRAMALAGDQAGAQRYFRAAAEYPDQFYGMLALERLGQQIPTLAGGPSARPSRAQRDAFNDRPITQAVREVARESDWPTAVRFFREIADQAESETDHVLVADLAREIGRRDLGVILGQAAHVDGHGIYRTTSYPLIPVPQGSNWTMVHAISRQESQFAMNAVSHAGARGLMQLMPGTAREQAGKMGLPYDPQAVMGDASYNLRLGDGYFQRVLSYFNGSYPLAVAAYNAGPGNVNKWLRANGDPRTRAVDWIDWIERIGLSETRNYVQRVLENAVVYEAMNPDKARMRGPNPLSQFLGKRTPG
ncbi:lytic transglycosylase [Novosphingobium sp. TH158]|nr:lytic transglycosylase [Novosphingobium sp. TH158]